MNWKNLPEEERRLFASESFDIKDLQDEIRADELCVRLLRLFSRVMTMEDGVSPLEAGALAGGADYFLRDFVISDRRENILKIPARRVRQFAGNWYIIKALEPNLPELTTILKGVEAFYGFCAREETISRERYEEIRQECRRLKYYAERIESFWSIEGDGYFAWERECSLLDPSTSTIDEKGQS